MALTNQKGLTRISSLDEKSFKKGARAGDLTRPSER